MNITWIGPTLLLACIVGVWVIGGPQWFAVLMVALGLTVVRALSQRARFM